MKLIKEINTMRLLLPQNERDIFDKIYNSIAVKSHKQKEIFYNLLLWRTRGQRSNIL